MSRLETCGLPIPLAFVARTSKQDGRVTPGDAEIALVKKTMDVSHHKLIDFYVDMAFSGTQLRQLIGSGLLTGEHVPHLTVSMPSAIGPVQAMAHGLQPGEVRVFGRTSQELGYEVLVVFSCNDKAGNPHIVARWSNAYKFDEGEDAPAPVTLPSSGFHEAAASKMLKTLQQHPECSPGFIRLAQLCEPNKTFNSNQPVAIVRFTDSIFIICLHIFSYAR